VTPLFFALIFLSLSLVLPSYEHYILLFNIFVLCSFFYLISQKNQSNTYNKKYYL
jgi:lipopolysaccharide export LptBFGC system permease protein LptF